MIVAPLVAILRSYLSDGGDLVTSRNLFLLGCVNFMGLAALRPALLQDYRGDHSIGDVLLLITGAALFFFSFQWAYGRWRLPAAIASNRWALSPPATSLNIWIVASTALVAGLFASVTMLQIPVFGQILAVIGRLLPAAAVALFIFAWLRSPANIGLLLGAATALAAALFFALFGSGRHPLFAALAAVPIAFYWARWRYLRTSATLLRVGVLGIAALLLILVYSGFRHDTTEFGDAGVAIDRLRRLGEFELGTGGGIEDFLQEDAIICSLLCIEEYHRFGRPDYFHTFWFIVANPIPREWWDDKPEGLGEILPRARRDSLLGYVNWGPGIIGHAFHDGGVWMTIVYGLLLGGSLRILDDLMRRQPLNPWMVAMMAAISPKILAFSRGDIGLYTVEILGVVVGTVLFLRILGPVLGAVPEEEFQLHDDDLAWEEVDEAVGPPAATPSGPAAFG
jgi:hypothetical protein